MKSLKWVSLVALAIVAAFTGIVGGRFFNRTEAQTQNQALQSEMQTKPNAVSWERTEKTINVVNDKLILSIPSFSPDIDWIIGVKPIEEGRKEKMYVGVITWEELVDKDGKAKGLGLKKISKMEDYPQDATSNINGATSFANILVADQTLVVYLEVTPSTKLAVVENGKESLNKTSEGSFVVFNGEKGSAKIEGPASLITELRMRKMKKEVTQAGHVFKIEGKEEN